MAGHGSKFGRKKDAAIAALLTQRNVEAAARVAGISKRTLLRWMNDPEFRAAYSEAKSSAFSQAIARLQHASGVAVSTVLKIMIDPNVPASTRLRAADIVLDRTTKAVKIEDIEARVEELERAPDTARKSGKGTAVITLARTQVSPAAVAKPVSAASSSRILAAPTETAMHGEAVSIGELGRRAISSKAQKAKPKGPNGG